MNPLSNYVKERRHIRQLAQAGRPKPNYCEACKKFKSTLVYDHNHKTGKFRGWICSQCNIALGMVNDSIYILHRLTKYLQLQNGLR